MTAYIHLRPYTLGSTWAVHITSRNLVYYGGIEKERKIPLYNIAFRMSISKSKFVIIKFELCDENKIFLESKSAVTVHLT